MPVILTTVIEMKVLALDGKIVVFVTQNLYNTPPTMPPEKTSQGQKPDVPDESLSTGLGSAVPLPRRLESLRSVHSLPGFSLE